MAMENVPRRLLAAPGGSNAEVDRVDDADLFAEAVEPLLPAALRLARVCGCSADEAADAVQESLIAAWRHRGQRRGPLRPWFLAIVRRRAHRPRRWLTVPRFWHSVYGDWPNHEGMDADLVLALRGLPPRQRAALWLRYGQDMSTAEVARVLEATEPATKQLLLRARAAVRNRMGIEAAP
jgi:RNA polymerase sigma-70 factor (ECF subfamily)